MFARFLICIILLQKFKLSTSKFNYSQFLELNVNSSTNFEGKDCWDNCESTSNRHYFGTHSRTLLGKSCLRWADVSSELRRKFNSFWLIFFPDEFADHNYCRNIDLNSYRYYLPMTNASYHLFLFDSQEWRYGPWCYVKTEENAKEPFWWDYKLVKEDSDAEPEHANVFPAHSDYRYTPERCFNKCYEICPKDMTTTLSTIDNTTSSNMTIASNDNNTTSTSTDTDITTPFTTLMSTIFTETEMSNSTDTSTSSTEIPLTSDTDL